MRLTPRLLSPKSKLSTTTTTVTKVTQSSPPPSSSFSWLQALKTKELQHIAQKTGLPSSGTKPVLLGALQDGLARHRRDHEVVQIPKEKGNGKGNDNGNGNGLRVLSIDMGIRNLAFAVLGVSGGVGFGDGMGSFLDEKKEVKAGGALELSLDAWRWVSLPLDRGFSVEEFERYLDSAASVSASASGSDSSDNLDTPIGKGRGKKPQTQSEDKAHTQAQAQTQEKAKGKEKEKESFSLPVYATHAHSIVTTLLERYSPTHILIERQRFRSGGGAAVQEWSLRVGVFEGMLWAVLHSLQQQKRAAASGDHGVVGLSPKVIAIEPSRVGRFWVPPSTSSSSSSSSSDEKKINGKKSTSREGKKVKIDLVGSWLENSVFSTHDGDGVQGWVDAYMAKWKRSTGSKSKSKSTASGPNALEIGKLDDLADCLVQGVTWLEWERMKSRVVKDGLGGIDIPP
ncbi:uncharacterized protein APUU_70625S [Aspergillus puulaauensis]|uniref:SAP domain-containing protein n=1 Tax=Aspergillus puulaauensis TaxID=1220207 RepID=A0A7R7XWP6_9EURO|nr:uncharacterized protein APUU_70625S [Aspergillus puulaauensis]BCS29055.1 hypothetical protein APUU_70625S [Aspergillus puulaauensis]